MKTLIGLTAMFSTTVAFSGQPRIVGGYQQTAESWQVSLHSRMINGRHFCGGVLVDKEFIITAAHCLIELNDEYTAWIGGTDIKQESQFDQVLIDDILINPDYDQSISENDIAIAHLARPSSRMTAEMNTDRSNERTGKELYVGGWGVVEPDSTTMSDHFRQVKIPIASQYTCKSTMGFPAGDSSTVCAGYAEGKLDSCIGDSGGPLYTGNTVVGLVSFGEDCALPNKYGVYTRVSHYVNWINKTITSYPRSMQ